MKLRMSVFVLSAALMAAHADEPKTTAIITPKFATELADLPGKEGMMLTVEFPPGHVAEAHRHEAHTFIYILEGEVEMQVAGGELKRLKPGDVFYENPNDVHIVARNASATQAAKLLVTLVKRKGVPPVLPKE